MRKAFFAGLLICWTFASPAQELFSVRTYKAVDGLPQSQVNIILEDKNGYLWIGTHGGGLARFDGREFTVYTTLNGLLSNIVNYLKIDEHENLWIVHPRGLTKYDGISFKKFSQPESPNTKRIRKIFEYKDTLFFTTALWEMGKIHNDSVYYWPRPLRNGIEARYSHITPNRDVMLYLSDSTFLVRSSTGDFFISHKKDFNRLLGIFNHKGNVWLRTDNGYFIVDFQKRSFVPATLPIRNHILYYDTINDLFWTRYGDELLKEKILPDGDLKIDTAMRDIDVTQILVDSEGNTWMGTDGAGLHKYFVQDFDRCSSENLKGISAIHQDREGASWIGSISKGLWRIKDGRVTSYLDRRELHRNEIFCIAEGPDGTVWAGSGYGLGRYDRNLDRFTWFTRDHGLSNATIMNIAFDDDGNLWLGTFSGGVNFFDGKKFAAFTQRQGLSSNSVTALHYSSKYKRLFIGNEFGLSALDNGRIHSIPISGIENTSISSIQAYRDSLLLIGSHGAGIVVYNPKSHSKRILSTEHGLASDFTYFAAPDRDGYIWIGTEKGITRVKLNDQHEILENLHYDYDNGLTGVETNTNAFYLGSGKKYFGLIDGLYQFNDVGREGIRSFDLHLTNVQLAYGEYDIRDYTDSLMTFFKIPYNPQLPPDRNHITFHFNRVDKRYPKSIRFKYKLEKFDQTWSQPSSTNQVTYSNLPPGNYVFKVMATDNQGSWGPAIEYTFTIKTPFYQTASFIVGMFILFAGAVTLVLYLRVKQRVNQVMMMERIREREQENLRKQIARDFHDEMGNQLTRIINYVSLLKLNGSSNGNGSNNGQDLYAKVEASAKYLYTGTRDFIWSIDPGNDELSKLFIHIRDFGEKLFEEKNINFRAFNNVRDEVRLPYGFSREANLIFKEAMTNAFKYSGGENVKLSLQRVDAGFELSLEDDGIGFYTGEIQKSNGLKNIRERADRINAILRIHSVKKQGTKIVLHFKLHKTPKYDLAL